MTNMISRGKIAERLERSSALPLIEEENNENKKLQNATMKW